MANIRSRGVSRVPLAPHQRGFFWGCVARRQASGQRLHPENNDDTIIIYANNNLASQPGYSMHPDISEFSYGYALTEELIHSSGLPIQAAPLFPSLIEEGRDGGGYDVSIPFAGVPLFLQFKLSDCMVRNTAFEVQQGVLGVPFFRMHLRPMKHSNQHALLLNLESRGHLVFYAAPFFHRPEELNDAYLNSQVINRSIFIRPSLIGPLPDDNRHHISFQAGSAAYLCSKPRLLRDQSKDRDAFNSELMEGLANGRAFTGNAQDVAELAAEMRDSIREVAGSSVTKKSGIDLNGFGERPPRFQIAYLARAFFGCEIVLMRRRHRIRKTRAD